MNDANGKPVVAGDVVMLPATVTRIDSKDSIHAVVQVHTDETGKAKAQHTVHFSVINKTPTPPQAPTEKSSKGN